MTRDGMPPLCDCYVPGEWAHPGEEAAGLVVGEIEAAERLAYQRGFEAGQRDMRERAAMAVGGFTKERRAGLQPCEVIRSLPLAPDANPAPSPPAQSAPGTEKEKPELEIPGLTRIDCFACGCVRFVPPGRERLWHGRSDWAQRKREEGAAHLCEGCSCHGLQPGSSPSHSEGATRKVDSGNNRADSGNSPPAAEPGEAPTWECPTCGVLLCHHASVWSGEPDVAPYYAERAALIACLPWLREAITTLKNADMASERWLAEAEKALAQADAVKP